MGLAIHLLGAPRVERDGQAVPAPRGLKVWALLAYLLRSDTRATRQHLADLLFEDAEDPLAALRWNLSELRRLLGDPGLRGNVPTLSPDPERYVDVEALTQGDSAQALAVPGLARELLEGMGFASSPSFEVWLATERRHLQATAEAVLREAALTRLANGAAGEAADLAARLVRRNPLDENFQALLVRSLAAAGDGVGAARQAAACRELFRRALGIEPGATPGRGLGCVAIARGETARAVETLTDAIARCMRLPDAYLWGKCHALDALCGLAARQSLPQAGAWIDEMLQLAARSGMRDFTVRAHLHRAALGDDASAAAARLLACDIDSPALCCALDRLPVPAPERARA